jgi:hypothetical protein
MGSTPHKNVTLSLPEHVLRRFKVYAAARNRSMTSLMTDAILDLIKRDDEGLKEDERRKRARRFLDRIKNAPGRGTGDKITWNRDELYDRGVR